MCYALFAWFAWAALLAGIAKTATGKVCNECKHLVSWDWSVFKNARKQTQFSKQPFS